MKYLVTPAISAVLLFTSCSTEKINTEVTAEALADSITHAAYPSDSLTVVATGDTTETAVDWNGTYIGIFPCASCPGIETKLTLSNDKTYLLESVYLEENEGKFTDKGTFEFDQSGSFITLKDAKLPSENRVFFVGENKVWQVQNVGDRNFRKEYELIKK